ncbi:MAG: hypothetical protein KAS39_00805, partial [Actinomycetia bacterium]|nr:hypothetical protein [Actinomycetes bacterium]
MAWLPGFKYRRKLTTSAISTGLTEQPVAVTIGASVGISGADVTDIFTELSDLDQNKIAITKADGISQLYADIETFDSPGLDGLLSFNAVTIAASGSDFYIYYDSAQNDNVIYVGATTGITAPDDFLTWSEVETQTGSEVTLDLTTFAASDLESVLTVSRNQIYFDAMRRDGRSFIYKDYGTDYFTDFKIDWEFRIPEAPGEDAMLAFGINNNPGSYQDTLDNSDGFNVFIYYDSGVSAGLRYGMADRILDPGSPTGAITSGLTTDGFIYVRWERDGSDLTFSLYSDPDRTQLITTALTLTCSTAAFRYFQPMTSRDYNPVSGFSITGYTGNYKILKPAATPVETSWLEGLNNRHKLTIAASLVDAELENFPVAIALGGSVGITGTSTYNLVSALTFTGRKKIAVTLGDGVTQVPVEIDNFSESAALLHAKVPTVLAGTDTELFIYYDPAAPDNDFWIGDTGSDRGKAVWDSNYAAVYHMAQAIAGTLSDATVNFDLANNNMEAGDLIDGQITGSKAYDYGGTDEYSVGSAPFSIIGTSGRTIEVIAKIVSGFTDAGGAVMWGSDTSYKKSSLRWNSVVGADQGKLKFEMQSGSCQGGTTWDDNNWHHFTVKHSDGADIDDVRLFVDGNEEGTTITGSGNPIDTDTTYGINLGRQFTAAAWYYAALGLSEVRISGIPRSNPWIKATYNTLFDTFLTVSSLESQELIWLNPYPKRRKFTIDSSLVETDLTDFPVALVLNSSAGIGNDDLSDIFSTLGGTINRKKIAVTATGSTLEYPVEVEWFDEDSAILHTKIPFVSSSINTELYLYYGGALTPDNDNVGDTGSTIAASVWDSDYIAVWHFNTDPSGGSAFLDSTLKWPGTMAGTMLTADLVDGLSGPAIDFDGTDDEFTVADDPDFDIDSDDHMTGEIIFYPRETGATYIFSDKRDPGWGFYNTTDVTFYFKDSGADTDTVSATGVNVDQWNHGAFQLNRTTDLIQAFCNGATSAAPSDCSIIGDCSNSNPFHCGGNSIATAWNHFDGRFQEYRLSYVPRSDSWIKATYHTLFDQFGTWSNFETLSWFDTFHYKRQFTIAASLISAGLSDFPIALSVSDSAGLGNTDLTGIMDELSYDVSDTFAGTNGDQPNEIKWGNPVVLAGTNYA